MKKVMLVFGTRPEAIKMAPVVKALEGSPRIRTVVCVTGQHRGMLDQALSVFGMSPDYDLDIMSEAQDLFDITSNSLKGLKGAIGDAAPDIVLVQGDTTTAFTAGLASYYHGIPVGHVEAGLRTGNSYSPYPEENNRRLLGVLADYHFAPTGWARANLLREGVPEGRIWVTGNTIIDALMSVKQKQDRLRGASSLRARFGKLLGPDAVAGARKIILVTGHRRENFGEGFMNICRALGEIARTRKDALVVYPVHLNPNVRGPVNSILGRTPNVALLDPLGYEEFVYLLDRAHVVLTDSGGIQEEAPSLGKPVLVMRDTTERPEGVAAGVAALVGTRTEDIVSGVTRLLDDRRLYERMSRATNPYGDGRAGERIAAILNGVIAGELTRPSLQAAARNGAVSCAA